METACVSVWERELVRSKRLFYAIVPTRERPRVSCLRSRTCGMYPSSRVTSPSRIPGTSVASISYARYHHCLLADCCSRCTRFVTARIGVLNGVKR
eukprot:6204851-Pleurochrysis_carterae.AAC.2